MMKTKWHWMSLFLLLCTILLTVPAGAAGAPMRQDRDLNVHGFKLQDKRQFSADGTITYYLKHVKTGAAVVFHDNQSPTKQFNIGFATAVSDDTGANHVLEHALLGGSEKYPSRNLNYILQGNSAATLLNALTGDDMVNYLFETRYQQDFENLLDVYLDSVFHPMLLKDENLFRREGIRREYVDGQARWNGVVYSEIRTRSGLSQESVMQGLRTLFPDSVPGFDAGGTPEALKTLTYQHLLDIYQTYYNAANSLTYLAGDIDLDHTLSVLDSYFKTSEGAKKTQQSVQPIAQQNKLIRSQSTKFGGTSGILSALFSGLPVNDVPQTLAMQVLFDKAAVNVMRHFGDSNVMFTSSSAGGTTTQGLVLPGIAAGQEAETYAALLGQFRALKGMSKEDMLELIDRYAARSRQDSSLILTISDLAQGYLYTGDPFAYLDLADTYDTLRQKAGTSYFDDLLDSYFLESPYQCAVYHTPSDNPVPLEDTIAASPEELEQIKQETLAYEAWANTPEPEAVTSKIPTMKKEDFSEAPYHFDVSDTNLDGVPYLLSVPASHDGKVTAALHFSLDALTMDQVPAAQLLSDLLNTALRAQKLDGVTANVWSNYHKYNGNETTPTLNITVRCKPEELPGQLAALNKLLQEGAFYHAQAVTDSLRDIRASAKQNAEMYYSYEMLMSSMTKGSQWDTYAAGGANTQGHRYYLYLLELPDTETAGRDVAAVVPLILNRSGLTASFQGAKEESAVFESWTKNLLPVLASSPLAAAEQILADGYHSLALINDSSQDVAAVYQLSNFLDAGASYSGSMLVLANYIESNYLLPQLRGVGGAYGADMYISSDGKFYVSAGRAPDIAFTLKTFQGIGDFLRNTTITQQELDQFIISTVCEFDQSYIDWCIDFGGDSVLQNTSQEKINQERRQILSTTPQQLRSYAALLDRLLSENRVFITASQKQLDASGFQAEATQNLDTLFTQTQQNTLRHDAYIFGNGDGTFAPDQPLTRAQAAALLTRALPQQADDKAPVPSFTDVFTDSWYADAVAKMAQLGLMQGNGDGTFAPDRTITGEEFALIAGRASTTAPTLSVPQGDITRADAVRIINSLSGRKPGPESAAGFQLPTFSDVPPEHPAYWEIMEAATSHSCQTPIQTHELWTAAGE